MAKTLSFGMNIAKIVLFFFICFSLLLLLCTSNNLTCTILKFAPKINNKYVQHKQQQQQQQIQCLLVKSNDEIERKKEKATSLFENERIKRF